MQNSRVTKVMYDYVTPRVTNSKMFMDSSFKLLSRHREILNFLLGN